MVNHPFVRIKILISQTNIARNAKEVTYSLHALNTRNVRQINSMKLWARTVYATNILSSHVHPQNDDKHVKDFATQLCMILRNKLSGPPQLSQQAIPVKLFDTYALNDPGSRFTFLLDKVTSFLEVPCKAQASTTLQYLNTEHEMPLSKIGETVIVTPFDKINQQFSIARTYSTRCLKVSPANVLELNQLFDTFKELSHIYLPAGHSQRCIRRPSWCQYVWLHISSRCNSRNKSAH